ncbi:YegP family protein [Candidatus Bathyarchaeota archaeon]|nr:YegP family protein [Candidatus Bathyarchaeota archaeon]
MSEEAVFIYHQESNGRWKWHLIAPGGETIANSCTDFATEDDCIGDIKTVMNYAKSAKILKK